MYASFLEILTPTSRKKRRLPTMHGGVNQGSGDNSVGKQPKKELTFDHFREEVTTHSYSYDELGKKKEVNSTGSRLYV